MARHGKRYQQAAGTYDRLAVSLELGLEVDPDNAVAWYNLACARARLGREAAAMEALQSALELGFDNDELLATDAVLPSWSPNGRWITYESTESGTSEVYVRPFPDVDEDRVPISSGGAMRPLWNPDWPPEFE